MEIQPSQSSQPATPGQSGAGLSGAKLSQDEFLTLLVTQLQNQDPLNPMQSEDFAMQLATFNSLDQLISINSKLDAVTAGQLTLSSFQATTLIGKEVSAQTDGVSLGAGGTAELRYTLAADASKVIINITDSQGNLVQTIDSGAQQAGDHTLTWNGKSSSGEALPAGVYHLEVNAFDTNGKTVAATTTVRGVVTGVNLTGTEPAVSIGDLTVPVSAVSTVSAGA